MKNLLFLFLFLLVFISCSQSDFISDPTPGLTPKAKKAAVSKPSPLVIGYFPSWSETYPSGGHTKLRDMPEEVTHIFLAFVKPNMRYIKGSYDIKNTGIEVPYDGNILKETINILKTKNVKVIISIGGEAYWGSSDAYDIDYSQIANFVRDFEIDGIDWDFEPNGSFATIGNPINVQRFIDMISKSRALLPREKGFEISCAPAGCGALGGSINDDSNSPYAYANRAKVTGDDIANTFNAIDSRGFTISLFGFESTGHMIPVFEKVGSMLDFVAFQGYNVGSASQREIMYDSYAYYANTYGFRVAFGMHVPKEPWGPFFTYNEEMLRDFTQYVAEGGKHNRAGKGDGIMLWQLLMKSAINPALDGVAYAKIAYPILETASPVTTPSVRITSPSNNAFITEGEIIQVTTILKRANKVTFYLDNTLLSTVTVAPWSFDIQNSSLGVHSLKVVAENTKSGEHVEHVINFKVIDKNSIENIPLWNATTVYDSPGTLVLYNNMVWKNKWWTSGDIPGKNDVWTYVRGGLTVSKIK